MQIKTAHRAPRSHLHAWNRGVAAPPIAHAGREENHLKISSNSARRRRVAAGKALQQKVAVT
jgi:hypothetical protein